MCRVRPAGPGPPWAAAEPRPKTSWKKSEKGLVVVPKSDFELLGRDRPVLDLRPARGVPRRPPGSGKPAEAGGWEPIWS